MKFGILGTLRAGLGLVAVAALTFAATASVPQTAADGANRQLEVWSVASTAELVSTVNHQRYRIYIAIPGSPAPAQGFPVIYLLDGDSYFGAYSDAVRISDLVGGPSVPAILVGIGYLPGTVKDVQRKRSADMTPKPSSGFVPRTGTENYGWGGADNFREVIQKEIEPLIAKKAPIDPARRTLVGHSLGGLFVLHALLTQPDAFSTYVALSPSIWWSDKVLLNDWANFAARLAKLPEKPAVFIGVGSQEERPGVGQPVTAHRMVGNAREFAATLRQAEGQAARVEFRVFEGETHTFMPWAAVGPTIRFAFGSKE